MGSISIRNVDGQLAEKLKKQAKELRHAVATTDPADTGSAAKARQETPSTSRTTSWRSPRISMA